MNLQNLFLEMENYSLEIHSKKGEMIGKGQLGPTQRENNVTHTEVVLISAEKQQTVSNSASH